MPTVGELTAVYGNFMLSPRHGPGVCEICFNFTDGYTHCYACAHGEQRLDLVVPISYSIGGEQLHHALASYKRREGDTARRLRAELAAVLWRFLAAHEPCVARAANVSGFPIVTTVPSGDAERDATHPLRHVVAEVVAPTRDRHAALLARSDVACPAAGVLRREVPGGFPAGWRARPADRRHLDDGSKRPERGGGAQGRGRGPGRGPRHRSAPQSRVARERSTDPRHHASLRLGAMCAVFSLVTANGPRDITRGFGAVASRRWRLGYRTAPMHPDAHDAGTRRGCLPTSGGSS